MNIKYSCTKTVAQFAFHMSVRSDCNFLICIRLFITQLTFYIITDYANIFHKLGPSYS